MLCKYFAYAVIPISLTASEALMVLPSKDIFLSMFLYFERNIKTLEHCITLFVSSSGLLEMASKSFPQACSVVSSAKLHISVSFMKRNKSFKKH